MANEAGARAYCPPHLRKTVDTRHSFVLAVICSFEYELDATGNRLSVKDKSGKYTPYQYDPMQQLKAENRWSAKTPGTRSYQYTYAYDPNGNRIEEWHDGVRTTYTYGDNNEMLTAGGTSFTYDQFGNTLSQGSIDYTWDDESHLLQITDGSSTDTHEYDGSSRRMRSKWNNATDWTNFVYDELEQTYPIVLAEYALLSGAFSLIAINTWGSGLISSNRAGTKRYFHFDGLGSTMALTNSIGATTDTYTYSGFGVLESTSGTSFNPFLYCGRMGYVSDMSNSSPFGNCYLWNRYFHNGYGRFLSVDPLDSDRNQYLYSNNSPVNWADPNGLCVCPFRGHTGKVFIDCSCAGKGVWIRPEQSNLGWEQARCGMWLEVDAISIGGTTYKVDGSTCVKYTCDKWGFESNCCVNILASWIGKKCPYEDKGFGEPPGIHEAEITHPGLL